MKGTASNTKVIGTESQMPESERLLPDGFWDNHSMGIANPEPYRPGLQIRDSGKFENAALSHFGPNYKSGKGHMQSAIG